jgi:hypothetical protein
MDTARTHMFVPCGHLCVCAHCAAAVAKCPLCRAHVAMRVRVYHP